MTDVDPVEYRQSLESELAHLRIHFRNGLAGNLPADELEAIRRRIAEVRSKLEKLSA